VILQRSTAEVSAARRFDFWREAICEAFVDLEPHCTDRHEPGGFAGELQGGQIGAVRLCTVAASTHEVVRTPALIRRTGDDFLFVSVLLDGDMVYAQDDRVAELVEPGQFVLYDSARPYTAAFRDDSRQLVVRVPRAELTRRLPNPGQVTAVTIRADGGVGRLASGLLQSLGRGVEDVDPDVTQPLLDNVFAVLSAALAAQAGLDPDPTDHRAVQLQRAYACIRENAGDAELTPARIARAIGVSERYLYALFRSADTSPAKALMDERLARAHAALLHPRPSPGTMESLALSVGFKHAAHFSRAFKERYGLPPRQHREQALAGTTVLLAREAEGGRGRMTSW
jgi:AraC-like DNA-binding protein